MTPRLEVLSDLLERAVVTQGIPAASSWVIHKGSCIHASAHGGSPEGNTTLESLFDIASITKVMATTSLAAVMVAQGRLQLDSPVAGQLVNCTLPPGVTIRHLLGHTSGLEAWRPLFERTRDHSAANQIFSEPNPGAWALARRIVLEGARRGDPSPGLCTYSDLGFIVLGEVLETLGGQSLDALAQALVFDPMGLKDTRYAQLPAKEIAGFPGIRHVLPTGQCRPRKPAPGQENLFVAGQPGSSHPGEVDDDNAWAMGGVAAHAGLFSTARDVAKWGWEISAEAGGSPGIGVGTLLAQWMEDQGNGRGIGFDRPSIAGSSTGPRWGHSGPLGAFGHLGFTGCSVWVDRDREVSAALLTNRVLPGREHTHAINTLRPAFHEAVLDALGGEQSL